MMRGFSRRTALLLLPVLVQALVLPNEPPTVQSQTAASSYDFDYLSYGGPSTFLEHDIDDNSIKFVIPCPECSDEEKELLEREIISLKSTLQNTEHCTSTDPIGLEIDGNRIISTGESNLALQSHVGPLKLIEHSKHHIFNRTRWINHCGCTQQHLDHEDCDDDFQSSFSFEVLGLPSGQIPGFTVSYRQHGKPELLRFSTFPDIGIADSWRFGQSAHYKSPLLRLQKASIPTSTAILSSPSFSPSATISASSPSYTYLEKTLSISSEAPSPSTTIPIIPAILSQASDSKTDSGSDPAGHQHTQWCHLPDVLAAVGHGLEAVSMRAKSNAQTFFGKVENIVPSHPQSIKSNTATTMSPSIALQEATLKQVESDIIGHDELTESADPHDEEDSNATKLPSEEEVFYVDLPTASGFLNNPAAVKAFQVTSLVFIIVALSGSLFALVRRNPRLRARWAAMLEENRNQRLYRHAARKYRIQNLFSRFKPSCLLEKNSSCPSHIQPDKNLNWDEWEKRASLDSVKYDQLKDTHAISRDLLAFRKAHQFVDGIISAEEGQPSSSRAGHRDRYTYRTRRQRAWSFGSEKTAPPAYESDGEDLVLDADGPRFVVIKRGAPHSNISPDSSVISTSPRTSCADSDSEHDEKF